ncbi:flippase activity-associated protein Agl23 [Halostella sp. PRR32]|uniref:flippase activity-associated protein Agl23 n=1 Tax=Halostella sp. PRR32 TaxID=3098147 RepID=UPI002B1D5CCA|nr:flippase activity-associated protein Agl23 [Halostella sp. PRR32]
MADDRSLGGRSLRGDRTVLAVVGFAVLALAVRLFALGSRVAHWDEGRLGYAILRYGDTGTWTYDPSLHGPFLFHVNEFLFGLLGPTDLTARLIVALVGGLLPLAALLFRARLDGIETVAFGFFLALNPVLLYYSRFMRNDVLVAAFMLFALGFFVRAYDAKSPWHLYAGAGALALGLTTKENALLYLLAWAGSGLLLLDHHLLRATEPADTADDGSRNAPSDNGRAGDGPADGGDAETASTDGGETAESATDPQGTETATAQDGPSDRQTTDPVSKIREYVATYAADVRYWGGHIALAFVEVVVLLVLFYAPRGAEAGEPGLGTVFDDPALLPALVDVALAGTWDRIGFWISGVQLSHPYTSWLIYYGETLLVAAAPVTAFALVGFLADRYAEDGPRDLVALGAYWAGASLIFYPIVSATKAPWTLVHVVVPLAIPAAVGLAAAVRYGAEAVADDDPVSTGLTALLLVTVIVAAAGSGVYFGVLAPQSADNPMVQYGQPAGEMRPALDDAGVAIEANEGQDVLYYGEFFHVDNESRAARLPVENATDENGIQTEDNSGWYHRLPLPWYFEAHGAETASVDNESALARTIENESPPVVVARAEDADLVEAHADGYEARTYELTSPGTEIVIYVDPEAVESS